MSRTVVNSSSRTASQWAGKAPGLKRFTVSIKAVSVLQVLVRIEQIAEQVVRRRDTLALVPFLEPGGKVDEFEVVVDDRRGGLFDRTYLADSQQCAVVNLRGPLQALLGFLF